MKSKLQRLLEELDYYISQLDSVGTVLVDLVRAKRKYPEFLVEAGEAYEFLTFDLSDIYNALKRNLRREGYGLGTQFPRVPLEGLERAFIMLRDAAEAADSRARKIARYHTRESRIAKAASDIITSLAENAAKVLVSEAQKADRWTAEWEQNLGLRRWLR